jgi:hypothetical protein
LGLAAGFADVFLSVGLAAAGLACSGAAAAGTANASRLATASDRNDFGRFHGAKLRSLVRRLESGFAANTYSVDKIDES